MAQPPIIWHPTVWARRDNDGVMALRAQILQDAENGVADPVNVRQKRLGDDGHPQPRSGRKC